MQYIGIDVHKIASQLCFVDENGEIIEKRIPTKRKRFRDLLEKAPRSKILIEASTESETRSRYKSLIRALSRRDGYRVRSGAVVSFEKRIQEAQIHQQLHNQIEPLLVVMRQLNEQIDAMDQQLERRRVTTRSPKGCAAFQASAR